MNDIHNIFKKVRFLFHTPFEKCFLLFYKCRSNNISILFLSTTWIVYYIIWFIWSIFTNSWFIYHSLESFVHSWCLIWIIILSRWECDFLFNLCDENKYNFWCQCTHYKFQIHIYLFLHYIYWLFSSTFIFNILITVYIINLENFHIHKFSCKFFYQSFEPYFEQSRFTSSAWTNIYWSYIIL